MTSFFNLFANLKIDPTKRNHSSQTEMAYYMLDLTLILGNPLESSTVHDDSNIDGNFMVGANVPYHYVECNPTPDLYRDEKVRIDRTSQLLISMLLAISEMVKITRNRNVLLNLTDFDEIIYATCVDKSWLLYSILNLEAFFFQKRTNFDV